MDIERIRANHAGRAGEASMLRLGAIFVVLCMVLIAASIGAALYHHFVRKDRILMRMISG